MAKANQETKERAYSVEQLGAQNKALRDEVLRLRQERGQLVQLFEVLKQKAAMNLNDIRAYEVVVFGAPAPAPSVPPKGEPVKVEAKTGPDANGKPAA